MYSVRKFIISISLLATTFVSLGCDAIMRQNAINLYDQKRYSESLSAWIEYRRIVTSSGEEDYGSLSYIGLVLDKLQQYDVAEQYLKRDAAHWKKVGNYDHYAHGLVNLGGLYEDKGDYAKAEKLYREAAAARKDLLGENDSGYAGRLANLAELYRDKKGDFAESERLFKDSIQIDQETSGENPDYATDLVNFASLYMDEGKYAQAESLNQKAVEIYRKCLGENDATYATGLNNLGMIYQKAGNYAEAERLFRKAMQIWNTPPITDPNGYRTGLRNLASVLQEKGEYVEAEKLYIQATEIKKKVKGENAPDSLEDLNNLSLLYHSMGRYIEAEKLARCALDVARNAYGEDHPEYATSLDALAGVLHDMGKYKDCAALYQEAADIRRRRLGENSLDYGISLHNLASLRDDLGDYASAESLYRQALAIHVNTLGHDHPGVALDLNNLASVYDSEGDLVNAEKFYREAADIQRRTIGENHPDYATTLGNLGILKGEEGDYAEAQRLGSKDLEILKLTVGDHSPLYATSLNNLAVVYEEMADYAAADRLHRQALKIQKASVGKMHPSFATSLGNLAVSYMERGDYEDAEGLAKEAERIIVLSLGESHPAHAKALNTLAGIYEHNGDTAAEESALRKAADIEKVTLGSAHPTYAVTLSRLAALNESSGRYDEAERQFLEAADINKKVFGEKNPSYGESLNNLGMLNVAKGDFPTAERLFHQAADIQRAARGESHPTYAAALSNLSLLEIQLGNSADALSMAMQAWRITDKQRQQIFAFGSQAEQAAFAASHQGEVSCNVSLAVEQLPSDANARRLAASVVLSTKGLIQESQANRYAAVLEKSDPESRRLWELWQVAGTKLFKAEMAAPKVGQDMDAYQTRLNHLRSETEGAEQEFSRASSRFAGQQQMRTTGLKEVAASLPAGSALVEYFRYSSYNFRVKGKEPQWGEKQYVALIVMGGQQGDATDVKVLPLGSARDIETAARAWRVDFAHGHIGPQQDIDAHGEQLAKLVWKPVAAALGDCRRVYVSPDGELAFVSFGALPGKAPGRFLIDDYDLTYVATGRDLVHTSSGAGGPPLLVGAPAFNSTTRTATPTPPASGNRGMSATESGANSLATFQGASFGPLPKTRDEVAAVARLIHADQSRVLFDEAATKFAVRNAVHPSVLHLATHGFFLSDSGVSDVLANGNNRGVGGVRPLFSNSNASSSSVDPLAAALLRQLRLNDPMRRSGIALAGINDTLAGRRPIGDDDGILTAADVAGMDLWGTKLVVISACESGLGKVRAGEGVFGLRRAFTLAGAQNLVMSLWSIQDEATQKLIVDMYRGVAAGQSPQLALIAAQRDYIKQERDKGQWPHPFYWAAFVASGTGLGLTESTH